MKQLIALAAIALSTGAESRIITNADSMPLKRVLELGLKFKFEVDGKHFFYKKQSTREMTDTSGKNIKTSNGKDLKIPSCYGRGSFFKCALLSEACHLSYQNFVKWEEAPGLGKAVTLKKGQHEVIKFSRLSSYDVKFNVPVTEKHIKQAMKRPDKFQRPYKGVDQPWSFEIYLDQFGRNGKREKAWILCDQRESQDCRRSQDGNCSPTCTDSRGHEF